METNPTPSPEAGLDQCGEAQGVSPKVQEHTISIPSREELLKRLVANDKRWKYLHAELEMARAKSNAGRAEMNAEADSLYAEAEIVRKAMVKIRAEVKALSGKLAGLSSDYVRKKTNFHNARHRARIFVSKHERFVARQITKHNQALHKSAEEAWIRATKQAYWSQRVSAGVMPNLPPPKGQVRIDEDYEKMIKEAADSLAGRCQPIQPTPLQAAAQQTPPPTPPTPPTHEQEERNPGPPPPEG